MTTPRTAYPTGIKNDSKPSGDSPEPVVDAVDGANPQAINVRDMRLKEIGRGEPLVLFFGPPSIGKTVGLIRLIKYLTLEARQKFAYIVLGAEFRSDAAYLGSDGNPGIRDRFVSWIESGNDNPPPGTKGDQFLAVTITNKLESDRPVCTFVELPGELLFTTKEKGKALSNAPQALSDILGNPNRRKVVLFMMPINVIGENHVELPADDYVDYCNHVVDLCLETFNPLVDTFAFVVPKADKHKKGIVNKEPVVEYFRDALTSDRAFQVIYDTFEKRNMKISIIPFSACSPFKGGDGAGKCAASNPIWPMLLWDNINQLIDYGASSQPSMWSGIIRLFKR